MNIHKPITQNDSISDSFGSVRCLFFFFTFRSKLAEICGYHSLALNFFFQLRFTYDIILVSGKKHSD